jgi:hypothetical protein
LARARVGPDIHDDGEKLYGACAYCDACLWFAAAVVTGADAAGLVYSSVPAEDALVWDKQTIAAQAADQNIQKYVSFIRCMYIIGVDIFFKDLGFGRTAFMI